LTWLLTQIEQAVSARRDVRAVLDVFRRPESLRRCVIPLVEQGVECVEDESLIAVFGCCHGILLHLGVERGGFGLSFVGRAATVLAVGGVAAYLAAA
jgi:hypothetical protein